MRRARRQVVFSAAKTDQIVEVVSYSDEPHSLYVEVEHEGDLSSRSDQATCDLNISEARDLAYTLLDWTNGKSDY